MKTNIDDGAVADAQILIDGLRACHEDVVKGMAMALVQELVEERLRSHEYALNNLGATTPPTAESIRHSAVVVVSALFDHMKHAVQEQLKLLQFEVKVEVHQTVDGRLNFK